MMLSRTENAYICTAFSVEELLQNVARKICDLPYDAQAQMFLDPVCRDPDHLGATHLFLERSPRLYCTARLTTHATGKRFLVLEFHQERGFKDRNAWKAYIQELTLTQIQERRRSRRPVVKVHVGLGSASVSLTEQERQTLLQWAGKDPVEKALFRQWRAADKRRIQAQRETTFWRSIFVNPAEQKPDDVFFQLAVILYQERIVPEADTDALQDAMLRYMKKFEECGTDRNVACRVLMSVLNNFVVPQDWRGLWDYIQRSAAGLAITTYWEGISSERRPRFRDPDNQIYRPPEAAKVVGVNVSTLYRSRKKHGSTTVDGLLGFSVAQVEAHRKARESARARKDLITAYAKARKIDEKSAQRQI
jgi:hypothetical protein